MAGASAQSAQTSSARSAVAVTPEPDPAEPETYAATGGSGTIKVLDLVSRGIVNQFTGSLGLSVPVQLPSDPTGPTPSLQLSYNQFASAEISGVGWTLGVPFVERQSRRGIDPNADLYAASIENEEGDLIAVADGFRFKVDRRQSRLRKLVAEDGAVSWTATLRNGLIYRFGTTVESRTSDPNAPALISRWHLTSVEDRSGNSIEYAYHLKGRRSYLDRIAYGGRTGSDRMHVVSLIYEPRPDVLARTDAFGETRTTDRLKSINVAAAGARQFSYELDYGAPSLATGRSLLRSVTLVGRDGGRLPPARFEYADAKPAWSTASHPASKTLGAPLGNRCLLGDYEGRGRTDVACYDAAGDWKVMTSVGRAWSPAIWKQGPTPQEPARDCLPGDFDGDGVSDVACHAGGGAWQVGRSLRTAWSTDTWTAGPTPSTVREQCFAGDFDGDGKTDIACLSGGDVWKVALSTGTVWTLADWSGGAAPATPLADHCVFGDLNADGRTDLGCAAGAGVWSVALSTGTGWTRSSWTNGPSIPDLRSACSSGDFDGDGRLDVACHSGSDQWEVSLSEGKGWRRSTWVSGPYSGDCLVGDLDADGLTDLACYSQEGTWTYAASTSSGWRELDLPNGSIPNTGPKAPVKLGLLLPANFMGAPMASQCVAAQMTDDARAEIGCYSTDQDQWIVLAAQDGFADLLTRSVNPLGGVIEVGYAPSIDADNRLGSIYPLVSGITRKLDSGDDVLSYSYRGGAVSVADRDFRGFAGVTETRRRPDGTARLHVDTRFHQGAGTDAVPDDPHVHTAATKGLPFLTETRDARGVLIGKQTIVYSVDGADALIPHPRSVEADECDVDGCFRKTRVSYEYDPFGNVVAERDEGDVADPADGKTTVTTYLNDASLWLIGLPALIERRGERSTAAALSTLAFLYDDTTPCSPGVKQGPLTRGLPTTERTGVGSASVLHARAFQPNGAVACTADASGVTRFVYDQSGIYLQETRGPINTRRSTQHGIGRPVQGGGWFGSARTVEAPSGEKVTFEYDEFGRETRRIADDGSWTATRYEDTGRPLTQGTTTFTSVGLSRQVLLDGFGRPRRVLTTASGNRQVQTDLDYDQLDAVVRRTQPRFRGTAAATSRSYEYDDRGRRTKATDGDGRQLITCYKGKTVSTVDPKGRLQVQTLNSYGQTTVLEEFAQGSADCAAPGSGVYARMTNEFDPLGRLTRRTGPDGAAISWSYDAAGRVSRREDPDRGVTTYTYDLAGNAAEIRNAAGQSYHLSYDAENRVVQKDLGSRKRIGRGDWRFSYDRRSHYGQGRLTAVRGPDYSSEYEYDGSGRVARVKLKTGGHAQTFSNHFDPAGRIDRRVFPDGRTLAYEYDGPQNSVIRLDGVEVYRVLSFSAVGSVLEARFGDGATRRRSFGGQTSGSCSRSVARLCRDELLTKGSIAVRRDMTYDGGGDLDTIVQQHADPTIPGGVRVGSSKYRYDLWGRLVGYTTDETAVDYSYDGAGNLDLDGPRKGSLSYGQPGTPNYRHSPHTAFGTAVIYDKAGRVRSWRGRTFAWDADDRLLAVAGGSQDIAFSYGPGGDRVARRDHGKVSEWTLQDDYRCTTRSCTISIRHGGEVVASWNNDAGVAYLVEDHLRSTRFIMRGGKLEYVSTYPYGEVADAAADDAGELRFSKARYEPDLLLYWMGDRVYEPRLMRFLSPDRSDEGLGTFQGGNLYAFALNNPMSFADSTGFVAQPVVGTYAGGMPAQTARMPTAPAWRQDLAVSSAKFVGGWIMIGVGAANIELGWGLPLAYAGVGLQAQGAAGVAIALSEANGATYSDRAKRIAGYVTGGGWAQSFHLTGLLSGNESVADTAGLLGEALDFGVGMTDFASGYQGLTGAAKSATTFGLGLNGYGLATDASGVASQPAAQKAPAAPDDSRGAKGGDPFKDWKAEPRDPTPQEDRWPSVDA